MGGNIARQGRVVLLMYGNFCTLYLHVSSHLQKKVACECHNSNSSLQPISVTPAHRIKSTLRLVRSIL